MSTARRWAGSRDAQIAGAIAAGALVVRVVWVLTLERRGLPANDTLFYHVVGSLLSEGQGYELLDGTATARWPPAFTALVGGVYAVVGTHQLAVELLNAVLGAAAVAALYALARHAFGRAGAVAASSALALSPGAVMFTDVLMPETLYTLMVLGVLGAALAVDPSRRLGALAIGGLVGLAALTRGEGFLLALVPLAAWSTGRQWRALLAPAALLVAGVVLVVAPWTVRNAIALDAFVPVSTNGAQTLWSGHNPTATGGATYPRPELLAPSAGLRGPARELRDAEILRADALEWMRSHPGRELELIPRKLWFLNSGPGPALGIWLDPNGAPLVDGAGTAAVAQDIAYPANWLLLVAFAASLVVCRRVILGSAAGRGALALLVAAVPLYGFVLYGNFRYRVPLEPLMILLAAPLAQTAWVRFGTGRRGRTAGAEPGSA
ncbi:MAG: glycosyltransferase family 39 protein [Solirubrobacterales bacterium]